MTDLFLAAANALCRRLDTDDGCGSSIGTIHAVRSLTRLGVPRLKGLLISYVCASETYRLPDDLLVLVGFSADIYSYLRSEIISVRCGRSRMPYSSSIDLTRTRRTQLNAMSGAKSRPIAVSISPNRYTQQRPSSEKTHTDVTCKYLVRPFSPTRSINEALGHLTHLSALTVAGDSSRLFEQRPLDGPPISRVANVGNLITARQSTLDGCELGIRWRGR